MASFSKRILNQPKMLEIPYSMLTKNVLDGCDLVSINTYGYRDPVDITITRYDMEIASLKKELAKKNKELEELKIYESKYKVKNNKWIFEYFFRPHTPIS